MTRSKDEADVAEWVVSRGTKAAAVMLKDERALGGPTAETERRAKTRYAISLGVTLIGDHNFYVGVSENLSEGGLFVRTQHALPIGTRLNVTFTLPTSSTPLAVVGVVRWARLPDAVRKEHDNYGSVDDATCKPGLGIQFEELDEATTDAIKKFIRYRRPEFFES